MVPKVFEPLKFYCSCIRPTNRVFTSDNSSARKTYFDFYIIMNSWGGRRQKFTSDVNKKRNVHAERSQRDLSHIPRPTTYVILMRYWRHSGMKIALGASFRILLVCSEYQRNLSLLITSRRKDACTKCRYKRTNTSFHNKCEPQKYLSNRKHFDQIP